MSGIPRSIVILTACVLACAAPVRAGVVDSPLPVLLPGATTYHLYTVPGVLDGGGVATLFGCTSLEATATIQVGVELFPQLGGAAANDAVASSLSFEPGATKYFGTGPTLWFGVNSSLGYAGTRSSARILATSKKLTCTAFVADEGNAPPTSMTSLTIIAKTKQKGD